MSRIRAVSAAIGVLGFVALVTAAVLLGHGRGTSPAHPPDGAPGTGRVTPAIARPRPSPSGSRVAMYAPCRAASLTGHPGGMGLGAGTYTRYLILTNTGGSACTLSHGPSAVTGVRAGGRRVRLAGARGERRDLHLSGPANLQPGQSAQVALNTAYGCFAVSSCSKATYAAVLVGIGRTGTVRVDFPLAQPFTVVNGIGVSRFGVPTSWK